MQVYRQHPTLGFLQAACPSCRPTNSVKALKEIPFPMLKYKYFFSNEIYGSNFIKQHSETVVVLFIYFSCKHQRQRAEATYMPVKSVQ